MPMAEDRPATSESPRKPGGASYAHEWNRIVPWYESGGRRPLPATLEDVAVERMVIVERFEMFAEKYLSGR